MLYAPNAEQRARDVRFLDVRRSMIRFFGNACALLGAGATVAVILVPAVTSVADSWTTSFGFAAWVMFQALVVGFVSMTAARGLGLAFAVRILRGRQYVGWVLPSSCTSFAGWFMNEWRFYGNRGLQVGERNFGFEVAIDGQLTR